MFHSQLWQRVCELSPVLIATGLLFLASAAEADHSEEVWVSGDFESTTPEGTCSALTANWESQQEPLSCGSSYEINNAALNQSGALTASCVINGRTFRCSGDNHFPASSNRTLALFNIDLVVRAGEHDEPEEEDPCSNTLGLALELSGDGTEPPPSACIASCSYDITGVSAVAQTLEIWAGSYTGNGEECVVSSADAEIFVTNNDTLDEQHADTAPQAPPGEPNEPTDPTPPTDTDQPDSNPNGESDSATDSDPSTGDTSPPSGGGGGTPTGGGSTTPSTGGANPEGQADETDDTQGNGFGSNTTGDGDGDGEGEETAGSISGGGTCNSAPVCTGDPLLCALNLQQWNTRCDLQILPDDQEILGTTGLNDFTPEMLENDAVDLPSSFDTTGFLGAGSCPADATVSVFGSTLSFSYSFICELASIFSFLVLLGGGLHSTLIVIGRD